MDLDLGTDDPGGSSFQARFAASRDCVEELRDLLFDLTQYGDDDAWELARSVRHRIDELETVGADDEGEEESVEEVDDSVLESVSSAPESGGVEDQPTRPDGPDLSTLSPYQLKEHLIRHIDDRGELLRLHDALALRPLYGFEELRMHVVNCLADLGVEVEPAAPIVRSESLDEEAHLEPTETSFSDSSEVGHPLRQAGEEIREPSATLFDSRRNGNQAEPGRDSDLLSLPWSRLRLRDRRDLDSALGAAWRWGTHKVEPVTAAETDEEYELHLAATEWNVESAILIRGEQDVQSRVEWAEDFTPFEHQMQNLITFCRRAPVGLIADDVGLGKTISGGLILCELMKRGKVRRALVLAPKLLLDQWKEELSTKFNIDADWAVASELDFMLHSGPSVVITTYDSARTRMDRLRNADFDMLILDEAHKLRNLYPNKPPKIAAELLVALKERSFHFVLMLTATPIQNRLWDLYSLIELLTVAKGHVNPLGSADGFLRFFVADGKSKARQLQAGRQEEFRRLLGQYLVRTSRAACRLSFPNREVFLFEAQPLPIEYELMQLVSRVISGMNALAQTSLAQAAMSSPQALIAQLRSMEDRGTVPVGSSDRAEELVERSGKPGKLRRLLSLARELQTERGAEWRMLVFTCRKETQKLIGSELAKAFGPNAVAFIRGGQAAMNQRAIRGYSVDPPLHNVIVSTDAGAEGVNLQAGNVVVNYDLPWNPMVLEQRIGRVQRLGSKHGKVIVANLVIAGSVEERIVGRLAEKLLTISASLGDIEGILESMKADGEGDDSFEAMIRKMVITSLKGMDVELSVARMQESIERAKRIYEDEKRVVDEHVGTLDSMHREGPFPPELAQVEPRIASEEFARRSLEHEGARLEPKGDGLFRLRRTGYADRTITFDPRYRPEEARRVIGRGSSPDVYAPGKPEFNKLTERWVARGGHHLRRLHVTSQERLEETVQELLTGFGDAELVELRVQPRSIAFHGDLVVAASSSVDCDRYEKIVTVPISTEQHDSFDVHEGVRVEQLGRALAADQVAPILEEALTDAGRCDPDVAAFADYYLARRAEEVERAGKEPQLRARAEERFTPTVACRAVGLSGALYEEALATVSFRLAGEGPTR